MVVTATTLTGDESAEEDMIEEIVRILERHGLMYVRYPRQGMVDTLDLSFTTPSGDHIGIECKRTRSLRSIQRVDRFLYEISRAFGPLNLREIIFVTTAFPPDVIDSLDAYHGVEFVTLDRLSKFLERYKKPARKRKPGVGARIRGNQDQIVLATAALSAQIDEQLSALRTPSTITTPI